MTDDLNFEKPLNAIKAKIDTLAKTMNPTPAVREELKELRSQLACLQRDIYAKLSPWERTQVARHPQRPTALAYANLLFENFTELHGDRTFSDDPAILGGLATLAGRSIMVVAHHKGRTLKERVKRNFGMPNPEGYRKALRLMKLAEKFNKPILTLLDSPGGNPGMGAEERGQAQAIAQNLMAMAALRVPSISLVIGEGGSGGALAMGVTDRILMLEHSIYSVISPEGCAAILWGSGDKVPEAAEALRLTADDLLAFGIVDEIIPEPVGGAHENPSGMAEQIVMSLTTHFQKLAAVPIDELVDLRYEKFRHIGRFNE
ncbi:MAG: acetyl-CoA carboxylase carboxyl transferase subunit alpha [Nitrospiraceae bacterium]|nr:acetyl-CoA carboxylase carboxyl transferase subunit alpha [Nitrospiraceae bacterium]|tara:strand:+ start:2502 stop:3452 length:951 start_codon:yes stop_codon:yes gene_type:complete